MVPISLITWNRPDTSALAIDGIIANTKPENLSLTVLDNGSNVELVEFLQRRYKEGKISQLILLNRNIGLEPARNESFKLATKFTDAKYIVTTDNDCIPEPIKDGKDWIERLVDLMEKNPQYAAISSRTQVMVGTGNLFEDTSDIVDFPHPGGSLRIMRVDAVEKAGYWRDDMQSRGAEERYICGKLRELGHKTGFSSYVRCLHLFGDKSTDYWGYPKGWKPEDSGHTPGVWHPVFDQGDDPKEVKGYFNGYRDNYLVSVLKAD